MFKRPRKTHKKIMSPSEFRYSLSQIYHVDMVTIVCIYLTGLYKLIWRRMNRFSENISVWHKNCMRDGSWTNEQILIYFHWIGFLGQFSHRVMTHFFLSFFLRFFKVVVMDLPPPQKKNCLDPSKIDIYIYIH